MILKNEQKENVNEQKLSLNDLKNEQKKYWTEFCLNGSKSEEKNVDKRKLILNSF